MGLSSVMAALVRLCEAVSEVVAAFPRGDGGSEIGQVGEILWDWAMSWSRRVRLHQVSRGSSLER